MIFPHLITQNLRRGGSNGSTLLATIGLAGLTMGLGGFLSAAFGGAAPALAADDPGDTKVNLKVAPAISITQPTDVHISIEPNAAGYFNTGKINFTVSTNNQTGYTVTMSAKTASDTAMHSTVTEKTITSISSSFDVTGISSLDNPSSHTGTNWNALNTWGYSIDTDSTGGFTFNLIPDPTNSTKPSDEINATEGPSTDPLSIWFGAKVDNTMTAGDYAATMTLSATANPVPDPWDPLATMQQMTPELCAAQPTPAADVTTVPTKQLEDTRDHKLYWVAKLADGNCWMTQNLALGDANGISITKDNSDITADTFTIASSKARSTSGSSWGRSTTVPEFAYWPTSDPDNYGNYYNWPAATAGTSRNSGTAPSSICPKGWKLPTGGNSGQFMALAEAYDYWNYDPTVFTAPPLSLVFSGAYNGGVRNQGISGFWWSSVARDSNSAYDLLVGSDGGVSPGHGGGKLNGYSVRCVASGS